EALPLIRGRVDADLRRPGLPRERVVAAVVGLLEATLIRVGNEEYARHNRSFGLTTLRDRHVDVDGSELRFRFRAKAGRLVSVGLRDRRLARVVRRCQELPGQELFQYEDETGALQAITSDDVNAYLRETAGRDFTAKDFRTWAGTVLAYRALRSRSPSQPGEAVTRHAVPEAIREVAAMLGNTAAVCRSSYVHPAVVDAYLDGSIGRALVDAAEERDRSQLVSSADEERAVVDLLRRRLVADPGTPRRQSRRKAPAGKRAGRAEAETAV
ncbi:MAG TPA: hypothetical protein VIV06_09225, partial [Candidatus Limnocylindrales bacterium]